jgi:FKBP-type peptidyl-prolyl cis-trans isomerase FkpA
MKKVSLLLAFAVLASSAYAAAGDTETLPSGVIVTQIKEGTGAQPTAADTVSVNYRGTLANGDEFDSSYKRGQPAMFPLGRVIPCWTQGLQKMKVGGKAKLVCPAATAYGSRGVGSIPPNSDLTFEVELLKIVGN